ncbi:MAG: flagellin [Planctomycetota bacterium]
MVTLFSSSGFVAATGRLASHQDAIAASLERLATGKRVNRASDDPSAIAPISEFRARITTINKRIERFEFEQSRLGATEGGLSVIQDLVLGLEGLNITGANGAGLSETEREAVIVEAQSVIDGIRFAETSTIFNGDQILAGLAPDLSGLVEAIENDPELAQEIIREAAADVAGRRAGIGNRLNEIESERNVLLAELEGNSAALSSIEDADFARESAELVRAQILEQATIQAILVEREQSDLVLDLISGVRAGPLSGA